MSPENAIVTGSFLTIYGPWISAAGKDAFWSCSFSVDKIDISTNQNEDHVSNIASMLRLWSPFISFMHITGSFPRDPDLLIIVATDAVETEALAVVSFFEKSVCKNFLCRLLHFGLQLLLLQCFDR